MLFLHNTITNDINDQNAEILEMKNENPCQNTICAENKFNKAQEPQNRLIFVTSTNICATKVTETHLNDQRIKIENVTSDDNVISKNTIGDVVNTTTKKPKVTKNKQMRINTFLDPQTPRKRKISWKEGIKSEHDNEEKINNQIGPSDKLNMKQTSMN